ncbi:23S rRNA (adenine(2503)-C(2))-methyltransferase RlmN [Candidatus Dependentiae bacterium]|nr:23S rRNA (adenine(2503)-C(2))-methyltransferase RlmN [Candidatus Dependentiae bacterium]
MKQNLLNFNLKELEKIVIHNLNEPKFRAKQIFQWLYKKYTFNINNFSNISKSTKEKLNTKFEIKKPQIHHISYCEQDNAYKFLLKTEDEKFIESILMICNKRVTLCISCMIGCPLKCKFCATGNELKFIRNLEVSEIVGQFLEINKYLQKNKIKQKITNIVFMGMGEPLLNIENVTKTLEILTNNDAIGISKNKITISTAGIIQGLSEIINKFGIKLAVSLHFTTDKQRSNFMPINLKYPIKKLLEEIKKISLNKRDYITIEYLMLKNINDTLNHAKKLVQILSHLKVKINLIPYNPTKTLSVKTSTEQQLNLFAKYLRSKFIPVTVRRSKGQKIKGGCGQFVLSKENHENF